MTREPRATGTSPPGPADDRPPRGPSRRTVLAVGTLGLGVVGAGAYAATRGVPVLPDLSALGGPYPPEQRRAPVPVTRDVLEARTTIGSAVHTYEVSGRPARYYVTAEFGRRLDAWLALHELHTGQRVDVVRSYGGWVPGKPSSWHSAGEAFDVARLRAGGTDLVSLRHDLWQDAPARELRTRLRAYWRLVAGLHHEFADVLTYLYDDAHANHVHVDTGRFGTERPRLIRRSRVQAQAVQAMCRHVWDRTDVEVTGTYDDATRTATSEILEAVGGPGELADSREAWQAFMVATLRRD